MFRTLRPEDVEVRTQKVSVNRNGVVTMSCLIYKNARVDRAILDETFGPFRWKNEYTVVNNNLFCSISIKDDQGEWITRQDVGVRSNIEREKGEASDAFKRAAFAWGIGVELYNAPDIDIRLNQGEFYTKGQNTYPSIKLMVSQLDVDPATREIITLEIIREDTGETKFLKSRLPLLSTAQYEKALERVRNGEDIIGKLKESFALNSMTIHTLKESLKNI